MNSTNQFLEPFKVLYEALIDGIIITDLSGKIEYANSTAHSILKSNGEVILNETSINLCFGNEEYLNEVILHLATKKTHFTEKNCIRKDGTIKNFTLCFSLVNDQNEKPIGLQIILKNPEEKSEDQYYFECHSSLLNSLNFQTNEILFVSDLQKGKNIFCSRSVEKIVGWSQKDYNEGGWAFSISITHPDDTKEFKTKLENSIQIKDQENFNHDHEPICFEYRVKHKNGFWINLYTESYILERDENNRPRYLITFAKDVYNNKKSEATSQNEINISIKNELEKLFVKNEEKKNQNAIHLSAREKEILDLLKNGLSTKAIANVLGLKITSVNSYRKNLLSKMKVKNTAELIQKSNQITIN